MMIEPPINELTKKADSRYSLVVAISKRARQLTEEASAAMKLDKTDNKQGTGIDTKKAVSVAINEIYNDQIDCIRKSKDGIEILRQS